MQQDLDLAKAGVFLNYLAKAAKDYKEKTLPERIRSQESLLGTRISSLTQRLDKFIKSQELKRFTSLSKEDIKKELNLDLLKIKKLLIQAKIAKADPDILFNLAERAEKIKKRIKEI